MYRLVIGADEQGSRLDRYLIRYFDGAAASFVYKHLRKKNIRLNGTRAEGSERLKEGDELSLYFADETLARFSSFYNVAAESAEGSGVNAVAGIAAAGKVQAAGCGTDGAGTAAGSIATGKEGVSVKAAAEDAAAGSLEAAGKAPYRFCRIVYEDRHIIIADKRPGVLSQKARPEDYSLNEALLDYVRAQGMGSGVRSSQGIFTPSVCNRLDRNTSGLIIFAKTYAAAREINRIIGDRSAGKYYLAVVSGYVRSPKRVSALLTKDARTNKVTIRGTGADEVSRDRHCGRMGMDISTAGASRKAGSEGADRAVRIETAFEPVKELELKITRDGAWGRHASREELRVSAVLACSEKDRHAPREESLSATLIRVELITGRSHQIRAQLAALGHPLLGDVKYGDPDMAAGLRRSYGISRPMLHSCELVMPEEVGWPIEYLAGRSFRAGLPDDMRRLTGDIPE